MGVRLYPIAKEGITDAEFWGFSKEEEAQLAELKAKRKSGELSMDDYFGLLYSDEYERLCELSNRELNGWGKFEAIDEQLDAEGYISCSGSIKDLAKVREIALANVHYKRELAKDLMSLMERGVLEGVCWC